LWSVSVGFSVAIGGPVAALWPVTVGLAISIRWPVAALRTVAIRFAISIRRSPTACWPVVVRSPLEATWSLWSWAVFSVRVSAVGVKSEVAKFHVSADIAVAKVDDPLPDGVQPVSVDTTRATLDLVLDKGSPVVVELGAKIDEVELVLAGKRDFGRIEPSRQSGLAEVSLRAWEQRLDKSLEFLEPGLSRLAAHGFGVHHELAPKGVELGGSAGI